MPGMMDTVLNIGLNDAVVEGLARLSGNERFAYDSYRRLINMFGDTVMGVDHHHFEHELSEVKQSRERDLDTDLDTAGLKEVVERYNACTASTSAAIFRRTRSPRARDRSRLQELDGRPRHPLPRAERDPRAPRDGRQRAVHGLRKHGRRHRHRRGLHAQSLDRREQVLRRVPRQRPGRRRRRRHPHSHPLRPHGRVEQEELGELLAVKDLLERRYKDVQDFEFTIEKGKLYMLQTRTGKRTAAAAVRIAVEMVKEKLIDEKTAILRVDPASLDQLLHPTFNPKRRRW